MNIGIIGTGVMGEVLIRSIIKKYDKGYIYAFDIDKNKLELIKQQTEINIVHSNKELTNIADIIIICVKPDVVEEVLDEISPYLSNKKILISIAAGIDINFIENKISKELKIIRMMPNTAAMVNETLLAVAFNNNCKEEEKKLVKKLFDNIGKIIFIEEKYMDAITAISGSGPAYVFLFIESLIDAACLIGLKRDAAKEIVLQTILGATKMVKETNIHPAQLKDMVTSPSGTTISALKVLEEKGFRAAIIDAVYAAYARSKKLQIQ